MTGSASRPEPPDKTGVLTKVSALLETLAARGQASVAELAEILDEPRSSVHRTIRQLADLGWVQAGAVRGQWMLGLHLFRLGSSAVHRMDVRRAALPHMQAANEQCGETIFLCIRDEFDAVCIETIPGLRVQTIVLQLGGSVPLHLGAGPLCLLAWADDEVHRRWLVHSAEHGLEVMVPGKEISLVKLEAELQETRSRGYAISDQNVTEGISAIGAPIFDYRGKLVASVSATGLSHRVLDPDRRVAELVQETAQRISFELGYKP